jgi:hypothetical protein
MNTETVSGRVRVVLPVAAFAVPETGGLDAMLLITHVLAAGDPLLGIGSGGPNRHPGDVQVRSLPVWSAVLAASLRAD